MKSSKILPWVILCLVIILAWITLGLSGYAQRSAGKGCDPAEEAAKKAARMAEKALKKASGSHRR
jgi:uncharacterized protein YpmB